MIPARTAPLNLARSARSGASPVWLALGTIYLVWGSTYLAIRLAIDSIPPLLMASARFLLAGAILYGWARLRPGREPAQRIGPAQWGAAFLVGGALLLVGNGGVSVAERTVPSGVVALLVATVPLWMALFDRLFFGRRLSRRAVVGLVIGFAGVALLLESDGSGSGKIDLFGALVALAAPIGWAAGSVYSQRANLPRRPLMATALEMLAASLLLAIAAAVSGEFAQLHLAHISLTSLIALGYLVAFGSIVAFSAYVWLLRAAPLSLVSTYAYVNPVVAVFLGWLVLSEHVSIQNILAGVVIVASVALIVSGRGRAAPERH
jgi:drug/metabolite transporter (DMT)-like permease